MANIIKIKRKPLANGAGVPNNLSAGELAFSEADAKLFYGLDSAGSVNPIEIGGSGYVLSKISENAPTKTGGGATGTWNINVTGNAGSVTNGVYATGNQTVSGVKTFANRPVFNSGIASTVIRSLPDDEYIHLFTDRELSSQIDISSQFINVKYGHFNGNPGQFACLNYDGVPANEPITVLSVSSSINMIAPSTVSSGTYFPVWTSNPDASATTVFSRTASQLKGDLNLGNVQNIALSGVNITAGSGLVGGGNLSANRTFDVGQGDGISVSADAIAVDSTVVRTTGNQTVSGVKSFTGTTNFYLNLNSSPFNSFSVHRGTVGGDISTIRLVPSGTNNGAIANIISTNNGIEQNLFLPTINGTLALLSDINTTQITGMLSVDKGGTGRSSYSNGQILIGSGTSLAANTLSSASGISITNGPGTITIAVTGIPSSSITNFNSSVSGLLPTIANSGDNRILTSTGSSVGINAESNLTFSNNNLTVGSTGLFGDPAQINIYAATNESALLNFKNSSGSDRLRIIYDEEDTESRITSSDPLIIQALAPIGIDSQDGSVSINASSGVYVNGVLVSVSGHTHTSSDITNFNSSVNDLIDDFVSTSIVAGSGATVVYSSGNNTLTISSPLTAGSGIALTHSNGNYTINNSRTGSTSVIVSGSEYQRAALTGDVTASQNNNATTIANDAVTNAKAANMAANTIKGRITASTGDPEDLTASQVRTILNVADGANNYAHPTDGANITISSGNLKVLSAITVNNLGHVTSVSSKDLTANDIPNISTDKLTSGTLGVGRGGTGATTLTQSNILVGNGTNAISAPYSVETTLTGGSSAIPRADAVKTYVDNLLGANDAMVFKGTIGTGGTVTALPTTHQAGWTYRVITAGTYAGKVCEIGDLIIAVIDRSGSSNSNDDWTVVQTNIDGSVVGPASSTNNALAVFDGTTGKLIKNSSFVPTTVGSGLINLTDPGAIRFLRINANNTVSTLSDTDFRTAIGAGTSSTVGTVTSVGGTGSVAGLTLTGTVTTNGNLTLGGTLSTPVSTINDSTTVGQNLVKLTNPSAIRFLRINVDNSVSTLSDSDFRTAIGAGTSSTVGTVTSVTAGSGMNFTSISGSGPVNLGTPSSITLSTTNSLTSNSHTHAFAPGGTTTQYIRGDGALASGGALTKTDDTNVTLTLGGSPTNSLLSAVSLTLGWTGNLAVNRGGTGQTSYTNGQLLIGNSTGNTLTKATLTQGTGIAITNGAGSISIAHNDSSSLNGAYGSNGISSITVDDFGHVTAIGTATYLTSGTVCAAIVDCTIDGGTF